MSKSQWGRPAQAIDVGINRNNLDEMIGGELLAIAAGAEDAPTNGPTH